ncbi:MAG TPA: pre-peptidase C-terminal domain-containing protein, partial [Rhodothermales bacterium]|nr:pre-peptidase C-terminal domain-containing protein [Rhodothermales bacterium]
EPSSAQINNLEDVFGCDVNAIDAGSESGTLNGSDCTLADNSSVDYYAFRLTERAEVEIEMESDDFDTFLLLNDDAGGEIARNDDASGSTTNSQIQTTLNAGVYVIKANSLAAGETGSYSLTLSGDAEDN